MGELWGTMISIQEKYGHFVGSQLYMMEETSQYFTINMYLHKK